MRSTGSKKNLKRSSSTSERKALVEFDNPQLTVKRQAEFLEVHRNSVYRPIPIKGYSDEELAIMNWIDEIHTQEPTWGYRTITKILRRDRHLIINRKHVRRIMRDIGIYAIYPKPNLSKRYHAQYIRPYLLRNLEIVRADQVWGINITYVRMNKGFIYLFVIIDWYSRYVVDYELSSTIDKAFVLNCLRRALSGRKPEIINSDQGSHFTNQEYIDLFEGGHTGVKISMDGKGQCLDNARTERFFRSLKYERVYINEYETPRELRAMLNEYMETYNTYRPHSALEGACPVEYYTKCEPAAAV